MTYVQRMREIETEDNSIDVRSAQRHPVLLVVEDGDSTVAALHPICEFLEVAIEKVPSERDLVEALREFNPMGVIAHMDCRGQDGCHLMMSIARHDRTLPILLITGDDPALAGAADAVEELWQLGSVAKLPRLPNIGALVDFLFQAGRKGRCMRLLPGSHQSTWPVSGD